jgi:hypothetical protein
MPEANDDESDEESSSEESEEKEQEKKPWGDVLYKDLDKKERK